MKHDKPNDKSDKGHTLPPAKHVDAPLDKHTPPDKPMHVDPRTLPDKLPAHVEPDPVPPGAMWLKGAQSSAQPPDIQQQPAVHSPAQPHDIQQRPAVHGTSAISPPDKPVPSPQPPQPGTPEFESSRTKASPKAVPAAVAPPHKQTSDPTPAPIPRPAVKP